ncbi:MAG: DMT family transporter [Coriobacteriales bacterium]|nr:DMT family transporter [Coriobacteriales bacterium]
MGAEQTRGARQLPGWVYRAMLLGAALLWGGSFVIIKGALDDVPPAWLMGVRFILSGAVMALLFRRRVSRNLDGSHWFAALVIGVLSGLGYLIQNIGLTDTTPGRNAFLTATYSVMVPFIAWGISRVRPRASNVAAALVALTGVGLLSLPGEGLGLGWGDGLTLFSAVFYAAEIALWPHLASGHDVITLTTAQFFVMGALCLVVGVATEPVPQAQVLASGAFWAQLAYLVLLSSCACTLAQNVGQNHVPSAQAALLLSLESVFGVMFSVIFYGEQVTVQLAIGFALVFVAVLMSEVPPSVLAENLRARKARQAAGTQGRKE